MWLFAKCMKMSAEVSREPWVSWGLNDGSYESLVMGSVNLSPVEEQQVLLSTEASLKLIFYLLW